MSVPSYKRDASAVSSKTASVPCQKWAGQLSFIPINLFLRARQRETLQVLGVSEALQEFS